MSKTILLADDSVTIRKVVELTFMEEDYELVSLGGGEEAVDQLAEVDADLVIADVHMPGVTGYDVCRAAKESRPERPVLLLVGTFEPFDPAELESSGADRHLKKPFDSQELLQTVRELLAGGGQVSHAAAGVEPADPEPEPAATPDPPSSMAPYEPPEAAEEASIGAAEEVPAAAVEETPAEAAESGVGEEATGNGAGELSEETVDRIARRVAELLGPDVLRDVAWEVVPDLAEVVIKERLRELEGQVE